MGNCHKNRICQILNNHCPQILLHCFQSILPKDDPLSNQDGNNRHDRIEPFDKESARTGTFPGQLCHYRRSQQTTPSSRRYENNLDISNKESRIIKSLPSKAFPATEEEREELKHSIHCCHQYHYCNNTNQHCSTRLEMMRRQRSASHCPNAGKHCLANGPEQSQHKCCCQKRDNLVQDAQIMMVTTPPASSVIGRDKRASSLRVLNKRFNFFDASTNLANTHNACQSTETGLLCRKSSRKHKRQTVKLNDLNDQCFLAIFQYLTLQEKLYYERVCQRWQSLIRRSLQAPSSLKIGEHSVKCNCQCIHYQSWDLPPSKRFSRDKSGYIVYPKSIIKYLLTLCSQLRCINFSHCYLDDETLQIIMDHSDMIQCLHLNDIRLEEDDDDLLNGFNKQIDNNLSNSQRDEETNISSAVGAFASEQLAVFDGLIRRLSTRRSLKKTANNTADNNNNNNNKRHSDASLVSKISSTASSTNFVSGSNHSAVIGKSDRYKSSATKTRSTPPSSSKTSRTSIKRTEMLPLTSSNMNYATMNLFRTMPNNNASLTCQHDLSSQAALNQCLHEEMQTSFENIIRKTRKNQQNAQNQYQQESPSSSSQGQASLQNTSKAARQRRHEWSKHRLSNKASFLKSEDQLPINVINETLDSANSVFTLNNDEYSLATGSMAAIGSNNAARKNLSPNISPNITCMHGTDFAEHVCDVRYGTNPSNSISSFNSSSNSLMTSNQMVDSEMNSHQSQAYQIIGDYCPSMPISAIDNMDRMDHVQAYVQQEQLRHELRRTHLLQWKCFAKKLGSQIRSLSLGSLSALDSVFIDILLKHCIVLEELRINNETDILSYLSIIKHTVKRIYINCEHGIGLECVSMLAFRKYAEKVMSLGRVDVPPELIDSVISTIGSNFSNLRSLHLRLHNSDMDVATPANLLFDNLNELNLQFVSGNVDKPFKKFIQLGWSSVKSLTIQYASITEESVRAIHEYMPQLKKLFLHAIEFRCDHIAKRYGHRICTNCSHIVWKCIASLHLNHLKLHRAIIDEEICKALLRMHKLSTLELQYCSNVNDNVINVCTDLARRYPRRRFLLCIVSRGFFTFKRPTDCNNLFFDVRVACN